MSLRGYTVEILEGSLSLAARVILAVDEWTRHDGQNAPAAARELAILLRGLAKKLEADASVLLRADIEVPQKALVSLNGRGRVAEHLLETIEQSTQRTLHPVLSPAVKSQLDLLDIHRQVLVSSVREAQYELTSLTADEFGALVSDDVIRSVDWPIHVFKVPRVPLGSLLEHVLLLHEIGHAKIRSDAEFPVRVEIPERLRSGLSEQDIERRVTALTDTASFEEAIANWAEEIYADAVGFLLAGPCYLSALCRVLGGYFSLDSAERTHPPTALRIRLLGRLIRGGHYLNALPPSARNQIGDWLAYSDGLNVADYTPIRGEELLGRVVTDVVEQLTARYDDIVAIAKTHLGDHVYSLAKFEEDKRRGQLLFELRIPPVHHEEVPSLAGPPGRPLEPARIFSSCWCAYYLAVDDASKKDTLVRTEAYDEALIACLDAAEAMRAWSAAR